MRMKHSPKQQKPASRAFLKAGFSLLELMLGMALFGLLLSAAWLAWQAVLEQRSRLAAQAQLASTGETVWPNLDDLIASADNARLVSAAAGDCLILERAETHSMTGLDFPANAASRYLAVSGYGGISGGGSRSLSFWMRQPDNTVIRSIAGWGGTGQGQRFEIFSDASGRLGVDINGATLKTITSLDDDSWHHIAITFRADSGSGFTSTRLTIFIDGGVTTLVASGAGNLNVNTGTAISALRIGGRASQNEFGGSDNFRGQLAQLRLWNKALDSSMIRTEMRNQTARHQNGLMLDLPLAENLDDASAHNRIVATAAFSIRRYQTASLLMTMHTSLRFAADPAATGLYQLWQTSRRGSDQCSIPDTASGWVLHNDSLWHRDGDFFSIKNGVVQIGARLGRRVGNRIVSGWRQGRQLAGRGLRRDELCKITPEMTGFNSGGAMISEAIVRLDDSSFEAAGDRLGFFDSVVSGPFTETINGETSQYFLHNVIREEGGLIWSGLMAKYTLATGTLHLFTDDGSNQPQASPHSIADWERVFRQITYNHTDSSFLAEKAFLFSLGPSLPCRISNWLACRHINNDDNDDNASTCYHWFDFVNFDSLGASHGCHSENGLGSNNYSQCLADWEDSRAAAKASNLFGLQGYLATITTAEEFVCTSEKLIGSLGWLGASDRACERDGSGACGAVTSNTGSQSGPYGLYASKTNAGENRWYWVTGPEGEFSHTQSGYSDHDGGTGQSLYMGEDTGSGFSIADLADSGQAVLPPSFTNWASNEPNDWNGYYPREDYLHSWANGTWNDFSSFMPVDGYLVEYGGISTDPDRILVRRSVIDTAAFLRRCGD